MSTTRVIDIPPNEDIDPNDLMTTNAFVPDLHTEDVANEQKENFRKYYLNHQKAEAQKRILKTTTQDTGDEYAVYADFAKSLRGSSGGGGDVIGKNKKEIRKIERQSIIDVDTRNRNKNMYPDPSRFDIDLGKTFYNIKKIELVSTTIPNTDQVITDTPEVLRNNRISWENLEDVDLGIYTGVTIQNASVADYVDIVIPNHGLATQQRVNGRYVVITKSSSSPSIDGKRYYTITDADTIRVPFYGGIAVSATANVDTGFPTYTIELTPGNYNITSISDEIETKLNLVKRRNQTGDIFHYFTVEANTDTDVITFRSYITRQLSNNPLECSAGQGVITINSLGHGFKEGDYVLIIGSKNLGGISANIINGLHVVTVINSDEFTIEVNDRASEAAVGGGATIKTGKPAEFRLIFDIANSLIVNHIGFPDEDSSESIGTSSSPITVKALYPTDIQDVSGEYLEITTPSAHGLEECNTITVSSISQGVDGLFVFTSGEHGLGLNKTGVLEYLNCTPPIVYKTVYLEVRGPSVFFVSGLFVSGITVGSGTIKYGGDNVVLRGIRTSPEITLSDIFKVETVTANTFRVKRSVNVIDADSIQDTVVGTQQVFINHENHGFNDIESIADAGDGQRALVTTKTAHNLVGSKFTSCAYITDVLNTVTITTPTPHGVVTSDYVFISDSTGTDINGLYPIQAVDTVNFRISFIGGAPIPGTCSVNIGGYIVFTDTNSVPPIDTNSLGIVRYYPDVVDPTSFYVDTGFTITVSGDHGIIGRDQKVSVHRVEADSPTGDSIGGILLTVINHGYHDIAQIIDENNYFIRVNGFSDRNYVGGGSSVVVSSQIHGYRVFQSNTKDGQESGVLYRSISLEGENYLYLISKGFSAVYSPGNEKLGDIFAKLILSEPPGVQIFDGFITAPIDFNPPLGVLKSLSFEFKRQDGIIFNFNNTDLSFSIRVTEISDYIEGVGFSGRTGTSDMY